MGERAGYADRIRRAITYLEIYLSIASDGMQQGHCLLPWGANQVQMTYLPQHLQGVLVHGRGFFMYRTFHNLTNDLDVQIHTLLLTLEKIYKDNGNTLPPDLALQVDGGGENIAKAVQGMCELLIIMGLVETITITRLLVGHTHIDVDGFFGRLWLYIRKRTLAIPS